MAYDRPLLQTMDAPTRLFAVWTLFVVFCQCAGWSLSALNALNTTGYAIFLTLFFVALAIWFARSAGATSPRLLPPLGRFKRPFPLAFLVLTALAIIGGALYLPNNFDAHAYRTPRVLHWLAEGRWHWIHSHYGSLNTRGAAFEWITAPLFAFAKTDRVEFLINAICFLFLPGRIFAILTRLRVSPRVAYYWMWIFPTAYGFILQAGSIANDLFTAIWPMAALEFALRAKQTKRVEFVWFSTFAAALMTASKAFTLLLLPAWGIALFPALPLLMRRPAASILAAVIAAGASMIPTAILNIKYCGDWTGMAAEPVKLAAGPPLFQITVNSVLIAVQNFAPPIFPFSGAWDRFISQTIPPGLAAKLAQYFESDAARFRIGELASEEFAGLGFGVSLLLLTILLAQLRHKFRPSIHSLVSTRNLIALSALAGALIYMAQSGLYAPSRYLLPHSFLILLPIFALPAAATLVRKKWWRALALLMFVPATILLGLSPARPLFPAVSVFGRLDDTAHPVLVRAADVYSIYRNRGDLLRPIRETLPPRATVGLLLYNNPETSLWRPFGSRRVLHIRGEDTPEFTRSRGIQYVVIGPNLYFDEHKLTAEDWARANSGELLGRFPIRILARGPAIDWVLIRLKP